MIHYNLISLVLLGQTPEQSPFTQFVPFIIILVIFYVLIFAPQRKAMQEKEAMRKSLKKGDVVVTESGMHGEVSNVDASTVTLRIAQKVEVVFDKSAISRVEKGGPAETTSSEAAKK